MPSKDYVSYPVFKGLQKPLEFMGLQGRYITWAAASVSAALLGFMIVYSIFGFLIGLIVFAISVVTGTISILIKQRKGLHTKKVKKGVFVYTCSKKI